MAKKKNPSPEFDTALKMHDEADVHEMVMRSERVVTRWIEESAACKYVRFCQVPVSPAQGKEPVWEFKLDPKTKYSVDAMVFHHEGGIIFNAHGEQCVVPPGNIGFWRPL